MQPSALAEASALAPDSNLFEMKLLHFVPFLVLAACSGQDSGNSATSSDTTSPANGGWEAAEGVTEASNELAEAGLPRLGEQSPSIAPKITPEVYKPTQEPQFHFETEAITDAELKEFYLEMDVEIDGEPVGMMTFEVWGDEAPITVRNFLRYADEGFYHGRKFHRILRDFMIQGGSSNNTGSGQGPNGQIKAEFSNEKNRRHRYGVLSMARSGSPDSASSQFFLISESNSPSTIGLNGKYASFGIMLNGISVLEQIADIPVISNGREQSNPTQEAIVTQCRVIRGEPTVKREEMVRPPLNLNGQPERVRIQHVLISFAGTGTTATRTKEDAETLAKEILERAKAGEDFNALVEQYTDDPSGKTTTPRGTYSMLNKGCFAPAEETTRLMELQTTIQEAQTALIDRVNKKELTMDEAKEQFFALPVFIEFQNAQSQSWMSRTQMVAAFGDVGFSLEVGEIGTSTFDAQTSPFGWHIIHRYE